MSARRPQRLAIIAGSSTMLLHAAWIHWHFGGDRVSGIFGDIITLPVTAAAAAACLWAAHARPAERRKWIFMSAGVAAWGAGETVWSYYEIVLHRSVPFPSFADVGYLLLIPLAAAGILSSPSASRRKTMRVRDILDAAIIGGSLLFVSWALILGPMVRAGGDPLSTVIGLAYPVGDIVILALVLFAAHTRRSATAWLGTGLACLAIADSGFTYLTQTNSYASSGSYIDLGWTAGFILIGIAALAARASGAPAAEPDPMPRATRELIPYIASLCAVVSAVAVQAATGRLEPFLFWLAATVVLLLILHQAITVSENLRLNRSLEAKVHERTAELEAAMNKMGEARRLQDQFIASISHELRTPLTTLIGASATLLRPEIGLDPRLEPIVESMARGADRMSRLVDNLLVASALTDRVECARSPIDVADEIRPIIAGFAPDRKRVYAHLPRGLHALGDGERLGVALQQLLTNADKFAPAHTAIWIDAFPRGGEIEIVVSDEGPGIPNEFNDLIFERFTQIDGSSTRPHDGAGLGLFIARRIVEGMGGRLTLDPTVDRGATFRLALPSVLSLPTADSSSGYRGLIGALE